MRRLAAAALCCALAALLAACARIHVERPAPARSATVRTIPGATVIAPGTAPSAVIVR